jgi:hypothetical protein
MAVIFGPLTLLALLIPGKRSTGKTGRASNQTARFSNWGAGDGNRSVPGEDGRHPDAQFLPHGWPVRERRGP